MKKYASYYKCALQVNSYSYANFRGEESSNEDQYNSEILLHCQSNNISVVGLADHGNVDSSESLRKHLSMNNVIVFPGFEISSAEKIHMVCLFPPEKTASELNRFLGTLGMDNIKDGTETSTMTCLQIADKVNSLGGFWYAAHITGDNGILKLGKMNSIWRDNKLLAAQIPNSRENIDPSYMNIIKNKDPQYKRERMLALINAKDVSKPLDLCHETASVLIKMTDPTFENFVVAFKDPESRVRLVSELEKNYQSSIDSISITGGYLDGVKFDISDNLSTIIGGRGTGKSTIINFIRYALNLDIESDIRKNFDNMISNNLGSGGKIELEITSNQQYGNKFKITRRYKQNPVVTDLEGNVSNFSVQDILPTVEIYGQNEIIDAIENVQTINKIVSRLLKYDEESISKKEQAFNELVINGAELSDVEKELYSCNQSVDDLPMLKERLDYYKNAGISDKLKIIENLSVYEGQFENLENNLPVKELNINTVAVPESDCDKIKEFALLANEYNTEIENLKNQYITLAKNLNEAFNDKKKEWDLERISYDGKIKDSLKSIEGIQDKSSAEIVKDYGDIVKKVEKATPYQERIQKAEIRKNKLLSNRRTLIEKYKQLCDEADVCTSRMIKKINTKKLNGKCRLSISFRQDKAKLISMLKAIDGVGDKGILGIDLYEDFDVFTFVEDVRLGKDTIKNKYSLSASISEKITNDLTDDKLRKIEELRLDDIVLIELDVNGKYKKLEQLSKGQQCTAILNILLLDNKDPLIIDQPEDNLDNAFIAENLVDTIRENKVKRQYIFATHNANIPVFGDAELIITMEEVDGVGNVAEKGIGSIDSENVKNHVIQILEGGENAFKMREQKYGIK